MLQLTFTHGESAEEIRKAIERANPAKTVREMRDCDWTLVFPTQQKRRGPYPEPKNKGEFFQEVLSLDFNEIAIVYLRPDAPEIDNVYYIKTHL